jgi:hypothetical protein
VIGRLLLRRLACRAGRHDVVACAGREDHAWTWTGGRWSAELVPAPARLTPVASDLPVRAVTPPAGKNDQAPSVQGLSGEPMCRCGSPASAHPYGGPCTECPCYGLTLTAREELAVYRARHRRQEAPHA